MNIPGLLRAEGESNSRRSRLRHDHSRYTSSAVRNRALDRQLEAASGSNGHEETSSRAMSQPVPGADDGETEVGAGPNVPEHDEDVLAPEPLGSPAVAAQNESEDEPEYGGSLTMHHDGIWKWPVLWSTIMISGSCKMTRLHFESVRRMLNTFLISLPVDTALRPAGDSHVPQLSSGIKLPDYKAIRERYRSFIYTRLSVRTRPIHNPPLSSRSAGVYATHSTSSGQFAGTVEFIPPTEFARADLASPNVFRAMYSSSLAGHRQSRDDDDYIPPPASLCTDTIPIVRCKRWFFECNQSFSVDASISHVRPDCAAVGDTISIQLIGLRSVLSNYAQVFQYRTDGASNSIAFRGTAVYIGTTRFRLGDSPEPAPCDFHHALDARDKEVVRAVSFSPYRSPTDEELTPRQRQQAWAKWTKPALKAADMVVVLRPVQGESVVGADRLVLVYRFWKERLERDRHVFFLPAGSIVPCAVSSRHGIAAQSPCVDVSRIERIAEARDAFNPRTRPPVSSFGRLQSGELYFIYRFLLYWDGFQVLSKKEGSGEGVYLIPFNIPPSLRTTPDAIRILAFTPPGVGPEVVLSALIDDIVRGATEGVIDFDAEGQRRRIFLDLLGFVTDTTAGNHCLDVLGHSSNSCCHQCRMYRQGEHRVAPTCAGTDCFGSLSACRRTVQRHTEIRATGASKKTCSLLGIKHEPTGTHLVLHEIARRLGDIENSHLRDESGHRILNSAMDPFRACMIAPDHAIVNHVKDVIELCFKLLPNRAARQHAEVFILQYLFDARLPLQNRIWNYESSSLYNMSMTARFAVCLVAPFAFRVTKTVLISSLFWLPDVRKDTPALLESFNSAGPSSHPARIRCTLRSHLDNVRQLCTMHTDDTYALERSHPSSPARARLQSKLDRCKLALRSLDKPNLHRLAEMCDATLDMLSSVALIAELSMEKRHQSLKRAVTASNYKCIHTHAIYSAIFTDWQARLSYSLPRVACGDATDILSAYRLLAGRDSVKTCHASLPQEIKTSFSAAVKDAGVVIAELKSQGLSVLSPERTTHRNFIHATDTALVDLSGNERLRLTASFLRHFGARFKSLSVRESVSYRSKQHHVRRRIRRGSVLRVLSSPSEHTQSLFISHPPELGQSLSIIATLWCVQDIVTVCYTMGPVSYFARVKRVAPLDPQSTTSLYSSSDSLRLLPLTPSLDICAVICDCVAHNCAVNTQRTGVDHCQDFCPLDGTPFYLLRRENGYPPRAA